MGYCVPVCLRLLQCARLAKNERFAFGVEVGIDPMPFVCNELSDEQCSGIVNGIHTLPAEHPLRKDIDDGITVFTSGIYAIFHSKNGFYFTRILDGDLMTTIVGELRAARDYLCGAFELKGNDPLVANQLLDRFQELHGVKLVAQIEHTVIDFMGKTLMLAKFPSSVVRHMLSPNGGLLKTAYRGDVESLKQIPTLMKFTQITADSGVYASALVTEYASGHLTIAETLHYDILREIISRPGLGIAVGPIAQWDA